MAAKQQESRKFVLGNKEFDEKNSEFMYDRGEYSITDIVGEERTVIYKSRNANEAYMKWNVYIGRKKERPVRPERAEKNDRRSADKENRKVVSSEEKASKKEKTRENTEEKTDSREFSRNKGPKNNRPHDSKNYDAKKHKNKDHRNQNQKPSGDKIQDKGWDGQKNSQNDSNRKNSKKNNYHKDKSRREHGRRDNNWKNKIDIEGQE